MDPKRVRIQVEETARSVGFGNPADAFPLWYLRKRFAIGESRAQSQAADPALEGKVRGDGGLDGFHLDESGPQPRLVLVQAKYSEAPAAVSKGLKDFERALVTVRRIWDGDLPEGSRENKVLVNLRAALNDCDQARKEALWLELVALHLCSDDPARIALKTENARKELELAAARVFPDNNVVINTVGPDVMDPAPPPISPEEWHALTINSVATSSSAGSDEAEMHFGIGRLSELVSLYERRRDELFAKNVRLFLDKKANRSGQGPAFRIRETLQKTCVAGKREPELFAFLHNGITIAASDVRRTGDKMEVRGAYVLNGCQTISTAWMFFTDSSTQKRIDHSRWERVAVPVRITVSRDEALIREVTIANNRQNPISPAALRAADPVQLSLEHRFRKAGIFYERQEGAFRAVEAKAPQLLDHQFPNSGRRAIHIVQIARAIAAASGGSDLVHLAHHPNDIFENDAAYARVFSDSHLQSLTLLTFLQNLHDVVPLVLKMDMNLQPNVGGPKASRLTFYAICLLARHLAKQREDERVVEFGRNLWGKQMQFRKWVARQLSNHESGIRGAFTDRFMTLEETSTDSLKAAFQRCEAKLRLTEAIDPFAYFARLDDVRGLEGEADLAFV